jgi:hypothetical protein
MNHLRYSKFFGLFVSSHLSNDEFHTSLFSHFQDLTLTFKKNVLFFYMPYAHCIVIVIICYLMNIWIKVIKGQGKSCKLTIYDILSRPFDLNYFSLLSR